MRQAARQFQQGATALIVALWMGVALSCLMVLDIGNLFWQQRELQKMADLAALAGASGSVPTACLGTAGAVAHENAVANGMKDANTQLKAMFGAWRPGGRDPATFFQEGAQPLNACHVEVTRTVPYFFVFNAPEGGRRTLHAQATAIQSAPVVKIGVRSTLASLNTDMSPLLNPLIGGLLGGQLNLDAVAWKGIATANLNLLKYLDLLALEAKVTAGDYQQLLQTDVGLGVVLEAMVNVLEQQGDTASVGLEALRSIQALANVSGLRLKLGQLLGIQAGTPVSALDTSLNVLELVQAMVQVGNSNNAASAAIKIPVPGVVGVDIALKVIEPPQLFAMGNPQSVQAPNDPLGSDRIFIRTAQVRLLVSVDMKQTMGALPPDLLKITNGLVDVADGLVNGVLTLLSPVLNLINLLAGGVDFSNPSPQYLLPKLLLKSLRLDVSVDVGGGQAYVTDYHCDAAGKTVTTKASSSLAKIRLGQWGSSNAEAQANAFANTLEPTVAPVNLLRLDCSGCDGLNKVTEQYFGGLGLRLDTRVGGGEPEGGNTVVLPAGDLNQEPVWTQAVKTQKILDGLGSTASSLNLLAPLEADPRAPSAGLQGIINALSTIVSGLLGVVTGLLSKVLSPLLDPVLDMLLKLLGLQLGTLDVAAQLQCGGGAELVY